MKFFDLLSTEDMERLRVRDSGPFFVCFHGREERVQRCQECEIMREGL
ncbi:hypothetical protein COLO4_04846 [Corchorus olitorius]|uniref:Uncharacterized protein n=1 Tax=Corchorus olitorius TaxID=93759 RepID=A0A1R3KSP0_9ROSI|nr:hypothetical protein COLO4_04846 [Corchorus olitorius]